MIKQEIHEILLGGEDSERNGKRINAYFNEDSIDQWLGDYGKKSKKIEHDEPWLTLIALYSIFGDQANLNETKVIDNLHSLLKSATPGWDHKITSVEKVQVEYQTPDILKYRASLKEMAEKELYHLYPDRNILMDKKRQKDDARFEGNTNMDVYMEVLCEKSRVAIIIEAKFLSDISYQIKYNPVRDQIVRNIDCGISMLLHEDRDDKDQKKYEKIDDFYFLLLTPGVFRPEKFGPKVSSLLNPFGPDSSRLYCYKMQDYKDSYHLKNALPHRQDYSNINWERISSNIGWLTFEEMLKASRDNDLIADKEEREAVFKFFEDRNISPAKILYP